MASLRRTHQAYEKENSNNAWKAFDTSSEAGRLLRQIYGNKNPPVNVPLPRRSGKSKVPTDAWRPGGGSAAAVDPRRATRDLAKERTVATVRRARPDRSYSRIDFVERKRCGSVIQEELDDARMRTEAYRPAHVRPIGESEKERFGEICAYKGGKILPQELTAVELEVLPHEAAAKAKEARRIKAVRRRRAGLPEEDPEEALNALMAQQQGRGGGGMKGRRRAQGMEGGVDGGGSGGGGGSSSSSSNNPKAALAEQLGTEIEERRSYLAELEASGEKHEAIERRVAMEISQRIGELRRCDPRAAADMGADSVAQGAFQVTRESAPFFRE